MALRAEDLVKKAKEHIEYKKDKKTKIAYLTLNRPDHFNATTVGMRLLYGDLIHRANIDDDVKVLVVRGAGEHFGTGGDLDEQNQAYAEGANVSLLHEFEIDDPDVKYPQKDSFRYIHGLCEHYSKARGGCRSLQEFKKVSIVEAKGYCYGWHFYQTGDADIVVSSEDALFGHPAFRYVGWGPRLWTWIETMGLRKFQEMLFTGRPFTAKEMYECGFINSVVPREKLEEETLALANRIAESDRMTLRMLKFALNNAQDAMGYRTAIRNAHSHHMLLGVGPYLREVDQGKLPKRMAGVEQALGKLPK